MDVSDLKSEKIRKQIFKSIRLYHESEEMEGAGGEGPAGGLV